MSKFDRTADLYDEFLPRHVVRPWRSRLLLVILAAAGCTYLCTVARYLNRPLRFDETEWPVQAAGILRHGVPKVAYSEDKQIWLSPFLGFDAHYGMWHPPLYQYSLALGALAFGWSNAAMRGVSVIWFLASLPLAWRILGLILPRDTPDLLRAVPLGLLLLTPLVSEGSLHLDIDNTSLVFFLLLFSYSFLTAPLDASWRRCLSLGVLFALALWSKLTTPFLLLGAAVLFHFVDRRFRSGIRLGLTVATVGFSLFLLTFFFYCKIFDYPFRFMFEHSYLHNRKIYQPNDLWPIIQSLRWHTVWLSPGISLLLLASFGTRLREYLSERRVEPADFLLISSAFIFFFYVAWGGLFGKYTVPGAVLGILGAAPRLISGFLRVQLARPRAYAALCFGLLLSQAFLLPALQPRPPRAAISSLPWRESILDFRNLVLLLAVLSLALFYGISRRFLAASGGSAVFFTLLVYIAIANPVNAMKVVMPDYDRSPYRPFFDRGFSEVVSALNAQYDESSVIICPKDVGYYFRGRHYPLETVTAFQGVAALRSLIESRAVAAVVDNRKYPTLTDALLRDRLDKMATPSMHGDFAIWPLTKVDATLKEPAASMQPLAR